MSPKGLACTKPPPPNTMTPRRCCLFRTSAPPGLFFRRDSSLRQRTARARRSPCPAQAFFGELLQRLGSGGSAAKSEWQSAVVAATLQSRRPHVQEVDVKLIKGLLEGCRQEEELRMPASYEDPFAAAALGIAQSAEQQDALVAAALHADPSCAASNAVPFSPAAHVDGVHQKEGAAGGGVPMGGSSGLSSGELPGATPRVQAVRHILPCLLAAEGRLDTRAVEFLASQLALSRLQLLDFTRVRDGQARCLPDNVCWCGPEPFPSSRLAAAAMLQRMVARCGGILDELPEVSGHAIVLAYAPQDRQQAAEAVALYLHLYCGLELEQAAQEAGESMGTEVQPQALLPCLAELEAAVEGWQRRVRLEWPYGGGRVELSGEAVGGWDQKVALAFDVQRRNWALWLWGLPPGVYRCKFIVDGRWCIDMAAPTEHDSRGNVNNLIVVPEVPEPQLQGLVAPPPSQQQQGGSGSGSGSSSSSSEADAGSDSNDGSGAAAPAAPAAAAGLQGCMPVPAGAALLSSSSLSSPDSEGEEEAAVYQAESQQESAFADAVVEVRRAVVQQREERVRFGAALLAFYTKLAVQRRVAAGHH